MSKRREPFPIVGSYAADPILKINAEDTVNMYEVVDPNIISKSYLAYWPGKQTVNTFPDGGFMRAAIEHKGFAYYVVNRTIYRVNSALTVTAIGPSFFATSTGYVGAAANENQIIFVDGSNMFVWDTVTATAPAVTLPTNVAPLDVTSMDGYTILISSDSTQQEQFFISALNDATDWTKGGAATAGEFALVNSRPTILQATQVLKRRLFLFGQKVSEIWEDAGYADFPFRRDNNLLLEHGVVAQNSLVQGFDRLFYLSNDENGAGSIMMVEGTMPKAISTREIDEVIQSFTAPEEATGFVFKINGLIFYQITFPHEDDNKTFVYSVNFNKWHRVERLHGDADLAIKHIYFAGKHLVGSYDNANLYEIAPSYLTNDGERMRRLRVCKPFKSPTLNRVRIDQILVEMLQGVGIKTFGDDIDTNPRAILWVSSDGGVNYQYESTSEIGKSGVRDARTFWTRIGTQREAIVKLEIITDAPIYIISAVIDYEVLPQ